MLGTKKARNTSMSVMQTSVTRSGRPQMGIPQPKVTNTAQIASVAIKSTASSVCVFQVPHRIASHSVVPRAQATTSDRIEAPDPSSGRTNAMITAITRKTSPVSMPNFPY